MILCICVLWCPAPGIITPTKTAFQGTPHARRKARIAVCRRGAPLALKRSGMLIAVEELFVAHEPRLERVSARRPAPRSPRYRTRQSASEDARSVSPFTNVY